MKKNFLPFFGKSAVLNPKFVLPSTSFVDPPNKKNVDVKGGES